MTICLYSHSLLLNVVKAKQYLISNLLNIFKNFSFLTYYNFFLTSLRHTKNYYSYYFISSLHILNLNISVTNNQGNHKLTTFKVKTFVNFSLCKY